MFALRERESNKFTRIMALFGMKANLDTDHGVIVVFDTFTQAYAASATLYFSWGGFTVGNPYFGSLDIIEINAREIETYKSVDFEFRNDRETIRTTKEIWMDGNDIYTIHDNKRLSVYWDALTECFYLDFRSIGAT